MAFPWWQAIIARDVEAVADLYEHAAIHFVPNFGIEVKGQVAASRQRRAGGKEAMRTDVRIPVAGATLAGWLYLPDTSEPRHPLIVLSHGFSALKSMGLHDYAVVFEQAGFACLVYDHRSLGESEGEPRQEVDPWQQVHDMRDVISYARSQPQVDPERIGLWGTSYSGSHVLVVGAIDRRVKCVVAQVPLISGSRTLPRWVPAAKLASLFADFARDRDARARSEAPRYVPAIREGTEGAEWVRLVDKERVYRNEVTLRSLELLTEYEPETFIHRIGPTPLLMIVAAHDTTTPTEEQLVAFNRACEPKRLRILDGQHYDLYLSRIGEASAAAKDWFIEHLRSP